MLTLGFQQTLGAITDYVCLLLRQRRQRVRVGDGDRSVEPVCVAVGRQPRL
jgi:hypothetical protein